MGFSVVLFALAHALVADAVCDNLPSCGTCLANSGCGWCASSTSCMSIASDGTVEGTCSDFQGSQCVGGSRDLNTRLVFHTLPSHQAVPIARLSAAVCLSPAPIADHRPNAQLTVAGEPCSYYTTCNSCARVPFCMFNNANGRCEFLCAPPPTALAPHATTLHSTPPPHPTTDHRPGLVQAGERRTACRPVHGVRRKVRPMTCTSAAFIGLL